MNHCAERFNVINEEWGKNSVPSIQEHKYHMEAKTKTLGYDKAEKFSEVQVSHLKTEPIHSLRTLKILVINGAST